MKYLGRTNQSNSIVNKRSVETLNEANLKLSTTLSWSTISGPSISPISNMCFGNGRFIIFTEAKVYYSDDGIIWNNVNRRNTYLTGWDIKFCGGRFVALPTSYSNEVTSANFFMESIDGITWTDKTITNLAWTCLNAGIVNNTEVFVGISSSGSKKFVYNADGLTNPVITDTPAAFDYCIIGANRCGFFTRNGNSVIYYTNFNENYQTALFNNDSYRTAWTGMYGNGKFMIWYFTGSTPYPTTYYISEDLTSWTAGTLPVVLSSPCKFCFGHGFFVMMTPSSTSQCRYSQDGITWNQSDTAGTWNNIAYGNGRFVSINSGNILYSKYTLIQNGLDQDQELSSIVEPNLVHMQPKLIPGNNVSINENNEISSTDTKYTAGSGISISANNEISAVGGGGGSTSGMVLKQDLSSSESHPSTSSEMSFLAACNNILFDTYSNRYSSDNGTTWLGSGNPLNKVGTSDGTKVMTIYGHGSSYGTGFVVKSSSDGYTWTQIAEQFANITDDQYHKMFYCNGILFLVGYNTSTQKIYIYYGTSTTESWSCSDAITAPSWFTAGYSFMKLSYAGGKYYLSVGDITRGASLGSDGAKILSCTPNGSSLATWTAEAHTGEIFPMFNNTKALCFDYVSGGTSHYYLINNGLYTEITGQNLGNLLSVASTDSITYFLESSNGSPIRVYITEDGLNYTSISNFGTSANILSTFSLGLDSIFIVDNQVVFIGKTTTDSGKKCSAYYSADKGATWNNITIFETTESSLYTQHIISYAYNNKTSIGVTAISNYSATVFVVNFSGDKYISQENTNVSTDISNIVKTNLPTMTESQRGLGKVDGVTTAIDENGAIKSTGHASLRYEVITPINNNSNNSSSNSEWATEEIVWYEGEE